MPDTNALFDSLLAAYREADDPDRFLREFLMRLDDATTNAVVATERKLDRLDAARARLEAAREIPRPDTSADGEADAAPDVEDEQEPEVEDVHEPDGDEDREPDEPEAEQPEPRPQPKRRKAKNPASGSDGRRRPRAPSR